MHIVDISHNPDAAYRFASVLASNASTDLILYEFHQKVDSAKIWNCEEGHLAFREKSQDYYRNIISVGESEIDEFPADIHVVIKINDHWFIIEDCGSNYYLGYGPGGIQKLRKACLEKGILILHSDVNFNSWCETTFKNSSTKLVKKSRETDFNLILKQIMEFAYSAQDYRETFKVMKEEVLRDHILPIFRGKFKGRGEVKCGKGKTDIKIESKNGKNSFIFELKIWGGIKALQKAIEQLINYLSWHHHSCGLIVFCKNKNFTKIVDDAKTYLNKRYRCIELDQSRSQEIAIKASYHSDERKPITIHFIFICLS